jgi:hypothetical protein
MKGKYGSYTFVIEFLGGTYVHQAGGESPEMALRSWLRVAADEMEWAEYRMELLRALIDQPAVPVEGCRNVWCMSGLAGDHLFLIHIIGTDIGPAEGKSLAEAQQLGMDLWRSGRGHLR